MANLPKEGQQNVPDAVLMMNTIRSNASANYQALMPVANADNAREIGSILYDNVGIMNEWLPALLNRIARVIIISKSKWQNPWGFMNKGTLEFGETVEEIYTSLIKGFKYDASVAEKYVFKNRVPDVRTCFHIENFRCYYPVTIQTEDLRKAFLSWDGVETLVSGIVSQMYMSWRYDEFNLMKYVLIKAIATGSVTIIFDTDFSSNPSGAVKKIKSVSNKMEFLSANYTADQVPSITLKEDQYVIISADADATMDVDVLASAFNMSKVEFMGKRVLVDDFTTIDNDRLSSLFAPEDGSKPSTFTPLSNDQLSELKKVQAVIVDKDFMQIYYTMTKFAENYNGNGVSWNYFYHIWGIMSTSPFVNAAAFMSGEENERTNATISVTSIQNDDLGKVVTWRAEGSAGSNKLQSWKYQFYISNGEDSSNTPVSLEENGVTMTPNGTLHVPANAKTASISIGVITDGGERFQADDCIISAIGLNTTLTLSKI